MSDRKNISYFAPWRFDCRLARELPDDKPIRSQFIVQLMISLLCVVSFLIVGWQYYRLQNIRNAIARGQKNIAERNITYEEVVHLRKSISTDGHKIGDAAILLQSHILISDLLSIIGRTRPNYLNIQKVQSVEGGAIVQGTLDAPPELATRLLGKYVAELRANTQLSSCYHNIMLRGIDRHGEGEQLQLTFEITLTYR